MNTKQYEIILKGVSFWNNWREDNPKIKVNFEGADLSAEYLEATKSKRLVRAKQYRDRVDQYWGRLRQQKEDASLAGVNFRKGNFANVNFQKTNLEQADFKKANLSNANLWSAILNDANLECANLEHANLRFAEFRNANLKKTNLVDVDIQHADLRGAEVEQAVFSTKYISNLLKVPLSEEQFSKAIFLDENPDDDKTEKILNSNHILRIQIDNINVLSPINLSYLFIALEGTYNNLLYLLTTDDDDIKYIKENMKPYYRAMHAFDEIAIRDIRKGSFILDLAAAIDVTVVASIFGSISALLLATTKAIKTYRESKKIQMEEKKIQNDIEQTNNNHMISLTNAYCAMTPEERKIINHLSKHSKEFSQIIKYQNIQNEVVKENYEELCGQATEALQLLITKYNIHNIPLSIEYVELKEKKIECKLLKSVMGKTWPIYANTRNGSFYKLVFVEGSLSGH